MRENVSDQSFLNARKSDYGYILTYLDSLQSVTTESLGASKVKNQPE